MTSTAHDPSDIYGPPVTTPPAKPPTHIPLPGRYAILVPLSPSHAEGLAHLLCDPANASLYDYMFDYPPSDIDDLRSTLARNAAKTDIWIYTVMAPDPVGWIALHRMDLTHRSIEIGHVLFTPALQRTRAATEAVYLLAKHVFELGFLRVEWKCNVRNKPSMRAAERFGFPYEGIFRKHMVFKGTSRDSAWYALTDDDWPEVRKGFEAWLDEANFDENGKQRRKLEECRKGV